MWRKIVLSSILLAVCATVCVADDSEVIAALRLKLQATSELIGASTTLTRGGHGVSCSCADYCTGQCFSLQCSPCPPAAFSFEGGSSLCLAVGPLGTGLLCHVAFNGTVTQNACCTDSGPTCWLPSDACCSSGDCSTCPDYPAPPADLFPPLRRAFDNVSNTCYTTG
jgi:hypothetical protein